jgi:hypothetical protein
MLLYLGCGENHQSNQTGNTEKTTIKFVLNDGKKWQMDEHTRNAIHNLNNIIKSKEHIKTLDDYKLLAVKLDEELLSLIRGCTMEGPAHDQLHIFIGYFYPMVQNLKKEKNLDAAQNILIEMQVLFMEYHKSFE